MSMIGVDCRLCVYSVSNFANVEGVKLSPFPDKRKPMCVAREAGLLLCQHSHSLQLWKLGRGITSLSLVTSLISCSADKSGVNLSDMSDGSRLNIAQNYTSLLELKLKGNNIIVCSALSPNGKLIAASDAFSTRLFLLHSSVELNNNKREEKLKIRRLKFKGAAASALLFTHSSAQLILATAHSKLRIYDLSDTQHIYLLHEIACAEYGSAAAITSIALSNNDAWLAVGDASDRIHLFQAASYEVHYLLTYIIALCSNNPCMCSTTAQCRHLTRHTK